MICSGSYLRNSNWSHVGACECTMEFESVMGTGVIDYLEETERIETFHILIDHYNVYEGKEYHFHDEMVQNNSTLRLKVNSLSGRS